MSDAQLPVPTPEQTALGRDLYNRLGLVAESYRTWFAEGVPHEWVRALEAIQGVLTQCRNEAAQAAREAQPVQAELFETREDAP